MRQRQQIIKFLILYFVFKKLYELYRLTKVIHRERNNSYALYQYDKAGNRLFMHQDQGKYSYRIDDDSNQLNEVISNKASKTTCKYDSNGNLTEKTVFKGLSPSNCPLSIVNCCTGTMKTV